MRAFLELILQFLRVLFTPAPPAPQPAPEPIPEPVPEPLPEPINEPVEPPKPSNREILYEVSKASIGQDLTPLDTIPDEVACVVQLQAVFFKAFGYYIGTGAARYNTLSLLNALMADPRFKLVPVDQALFGDIAVAPTGMGANPKEHGHCWIVGKRDWMSNNSTGAKKGLWTANYTREGVLNFFVKQRGFPLYTFRVI